MNHKLGQSNSKSKDQTLLQDILSYFSPKKETQKKKNSKKEEDSLLLNLELVEKILFYDQTLTQSLHKYYEKKKEEDAIRSLFYYIRTLDILAYGMKEIYHLEDQVIAFYVSRYLSVNHIYQSEFDIGYIANQEFREYYDLDITGWFDDIFYDVLLRQITVLQDYRDVSNFLRDNASSYLKQWVVEEFIHQNGVESVTQVLVYPSKTPCKKLIKKEAKFVKKQFLSTSIFEKVSDKFKKC